MQHSQCTNTYIVPAASPVYAETGTSYSMSSDGTNRYSVQHVQCTSRYIVRSASPVYKQVQRAASPVANRYIVQHSQCHGTNRYIAGADSQCTPEQYSVQHSQCTNKYTVQHLQYTNRYTVQHVQCTNGYISRASKHYTRPSLTPHKHISNLRTAC